MLDINDIDDAVNYAFLPVYVYKKLELSGLNNKDPSLCFMMKKMMMMAEMIGEISH